MYLNSVFLFVCIVIFHRDSVVVTAVVCYCPFVLRDACANVHAAPCVIMFVGVVEVEEVRAWVVCCFLGGVMP